jgi:hypothetical protein
MSVNELLGLARRHIIAVTLVLLVALGIAFDFKHTNPGYTETATVALATNGLQNPSFGASLITTCQIVTAWISGPEGQHQLQRVGVDSGFSVALVNDANADDPTYNYPDLTVSMTNPDAAVTHRGFVSGMAVLNQELAATQASAKVPAQLRITARILSDSGPETQAGSKVRTYGALMFLALVAAYVSAKFLDNRSVRRPGRARRMARTLEVD